MARPAARLRSSCEDSVNSRPIGTRWTAGGDDAGDMPKKRFNISLKGSGEPKPNDDIDMAAPGTSTGPFHQNPAVRALQTERRNASAPVVGRYAP
ncbi:hypothetical protein GCM10010321_52270 [Streptomyces chartreusis]|nr:hypothetical protein GCM10010321_52270 [Streptomyces chartreusis]